MFWTKTSGKLFKFVEFFVGYQSLRDGGMQGKKYVISRLKRTQYIASWAKNSSMMGGIYETGRKIRNSFNTWWVK